MRKILCLFACLFFLAGAQLVFAGADIYGTGSNTTGSGNGSDANDNFDIKDNMDVYDVFATIIEQIMSAIQADFVNGQGGFLKAPASDGCLVIDMGMPDTVMFGNPIDPEYSTGSFYLENCADDSAYVTMTFEFSVYIEGELDTVLTIDPMFLYLHTGEAVTCDFEIPILPFAAKYTLCATATADDFTVSDCAILVVVPDSDPSYPFSKVGYLYQGTDCVLFIGMDDANTALILENYGDFVPGDEVIVNGTLVPECDIECSDAIACVIDNTIEEYYVPPPPPHFEGCGTLMQETDCILFHPEDNTTEAYTLSNYSGFGVGDEVFVSGDLYDQADTVCTDATGYLMNSSITACGGEPEPDPETFTGWGELTQGTGCVLFSPDLGDYAAYLFTLTDYDEFTVGDNVMVIGDIYIETDPDCPESMGYIDVDQIYINQEILPDSFAGYGFIAGDPGCPVFEPENQEVHYLLSNYGEFEWGDTVYVKGDITACQNSCDADACLDVEVISDYGNNEPDPVDTLTACGLLQLEDDCLVFYPNNQSSGYLLDNYGEFGDGDLVNITGTIYECNNTCANAIACVNNSVIQDCSAPDPTFEGCGLIVESDPCTLFLPSGWTNSYFVLSDYGEYEPGDSAYVSGTITEFPDGLDCNAAAQYMLVDEIGDCPASTPGNTNYAGLGYLEVQEGCLLYFDAFEYYTPYVLENYGDFVEGDTVFVQGTIAEDCDFNCFDMAQCLLNNTIMAASLGDSIFTDNANGNKISDVRNYPNPFNPMATISFSLPEPTVVHLEIYNILGQKVETLINGESLSGHQDVSWNGENYSSGIYFYRIRTDQDVVTKKMLLSK